MHFTGYQFCLLLHIFIDLNSASCFRIIGSYMLYFTFPIVGIGTSRFDAQSIFNILGATLSLVFMIAYYEKSRKKPG